MAFQITLPAWWTVKTTRAVPGNQYLVFNGSGTAMAYLTVSNFFEAECYEGMCNYLPLIALDDQLINDPTGGTHPMVVRSTAVDLTQRSDLVQQLLWKNNVRLVIGLHGNPQAEPTTADPSLIYGTMAIQSAPGGDSSTNRYISFNSIHDFATQDAAKTYLSSPEYSEIQNMIASFKAHPCTEYGGNPTSATGTGNVESLEQCPATAGRG